jgi:hypothetical protein
VNYFIAEVLMRPVIEDIAQGLPEDFQFTANGLLIRKRLKIVLPIFSAFVGLIVAALMTGEGGTHTLALSVLAAVGVGLLVSYELTVLLSRSVTTRWPGWVARWSACARATTTRVSRWSRATSWASCRTTSTSWRSVWPSASGCARRSGPTSTATSSR